MIVVEPYYQFYLSCNDEVCMISGERSVTRRQLLSACNRYAKLYSLTPGGRVAVLAENRCEWPAALLSAWISKGVGVPLDAQAPVSELAYIFGDCEPEVVFCTAKTKSSAEKALAESACKAKLIDMDAIGDDWNDVSTADPVPHHEPDDLALLVYTSGTTSAAKGCMITFHNLEVNFKSMTEDVPVWLPDQITVALLPFHHIFPLQGCLLMPLHRTGCKIVFCPSLSGPDIVKTIHDNHVTVFIAVPRVFQLFRDSILKKIHANPFASALFALSKAVGNLTFSKLLFRSVQNAFGGKIRFFPTGGAALDYGVYDDLHALGFEMLPGSGMSEAAPVVAFTRPGHPRRESAGQLISINECKIAPDGEILLRGDNIVKGYWRKPKETAETFTGDGWLHTGDLGRLDEDNYLFYTGRKKELIILSNGKNVPPLVIEDKIMAMTDLIEELAVIADGDVLNALILPNFKKLSENKIVNISETIRQTVIAKYNQQAESYMRLLKCTFISTPLPRTRLGKLQRHKLQALLKDSTNDVKAQEVPEPDLPEYRIIRDFLKEENGIEKVHPDDHFEIDLGIDSLAKVAMLVFLNETFDSELSEQSLIDHPTPAALAGFLHATHAIGTGTNLAKFDWSHILNEPVQVTLPVCGHSHHLLNLISRGFQKLLFRVESRGLENIPDGPCIFACNHQSYIDGLLVWGRFHRKTFCDTYFYASQRHISNAFTRLLARRHNIVVVDMNSDLKGSLQKLAEILRQGKKVTIFPEGTRTHDGKLGVFKNTFAILSKELNVPIIPVVLDGAFEALPRGKHFPHFFQTIRVTFLPEVRANDGETYAALASRVAQQIAGTLNKH